MTDLMERLRAADPLAGALPDALPEPPRPPRPGADVRRRRHTPRLVAGAVAAAGLLALVVVGARSDDDLAAAAYAAVAPGDDVVHLVTMSSEQRPGGPRTHGELWYSRDRLRSIYTTAAASEGRPPRVRETAIAPTSWQSYESAHNTLLIIDSPNKPLFPGRGVPHGIDEVEDFKRFYEGGRIVEDGRETFDGQKVLRLVLRNAPDRLTYLVKPGGGEPVATRRNQTINGTTRTKIVRILRYERLPLNDVSRAALRMSDHPGADVERPTSVTPG